MPCTDWNAWFTTRRRLKGELRQTSGSRESTYNDLKVVAGDYGVSVLHPLDRGSRRARDLALKDDVHGLVGVNVGGPPHKLGRNCGMHSKAMSRAEVKNNNITDTLETGARK